MIGDGLNDAPALATADIGISMGISGSALATESGDAVLMTNDIQRIPKALRIARKVRRKIKENVMLSISTKAAIIGLAVAGHPLVWAAVLSDVGTCLLVIFNSMLLLRGTTTKSCKSTSHSHKHKHLKPSCCDEKSKLQPCSSKKCGPSSSCKGEKVDHDHDLESLHHHSHSSSCGADHHQHQHHQHEHEHHHQHHQHEHEHEHHQHEHEHEHHQHEHEHEHHHQHHQHEHEHEHQHKHGDSCGATKEHAHNEHTHPHVSDGIKDGDKVDQHSKCSSSTKEHSHSHPHGEDITHHHHHHHHVQIDHAHLVKPHSHEGAGTVGCEGSTEECHAVCAASKKVHRGCCDSYRRECCVRSGHFESNFRGGLSEIVID